MDEGKRPRILITRLSHIGDCILALPMLNALRDHFPQAFLAWVVERAAAPLLDGHRALDELVVAPRGWLKSPRRVRELRRQLRQLRCDVSIDPQGLTKSALCGWLAGARQRIGFARPDGKELSCLLNNRLVRRTARHMVDRGLELLRPLGVAARAVRFDIPLAPRHRRLAAELVRRERLADGFVLINPGAGWDSRLWPPDRYAAVARWLSRRRGLPSLAAWAGDRERAWAELIARESDGAARVAPPTSLLELAAILEQARFYLGSDTGPLHLAVAVGTPCVSLHGPTPAWQSGPYGPGHVAVQEAEVARRRRKRRGSRAAMEAISVERVCAACDQLLIGGSTVSQERAA